ncbi:MAG: universal stress protein [Cocleimonas sp.]
MYNTIIVPTDFSDEESTIKSLKKAEMLSDNGRIVLLHVLYDIPAYVLVELPADVIQQQGPEIKNSLTEILQKSGVKADIKIRKGQSYTNIIDEAKEISADLIMIDSHRPGLQDYLLGSTAAKVVRHAPCSVLVDR